MVELVLTSHRENKQDLAWLDKSLNIDLLTIYDKCWPQTTSRFLANASADFNSITNGLHHRFQEVEGRGRFFYPQIFDRKRERIFSLNNHGADQHTVLYHIITNWNHLADITVFIGGDPNDHMPEVNPIDIINNVKNLEQTKNGYIALHQTLECDQTGAPHHQHFLGIKSFWEENLYLLGKCPEKIKFNANGIFAVTKNAIKKNNLEIYTNCLRALDQNHHQLPYSHEVFILERLWYNIFK